MSSVITSHFKSIHGQFATFVPSSDSKFSLKQASKCIDPSSFWLVKGVYRLVYWFKGKGWINQKKVRETLLTNKTGLGSMLVKMQKDRIGIEQVMGGSHYQVSKPCLLLEEAKHLEKISHLVRNLLSVHFSHPSAAPLVNDLFKMQQEIQAISKCFQASTNNGIQAVQKFGPSSKEELAKFDTTLEPPTEWGILNEITLRELSEDKGYTSHLASHSNCSKKNRFRDVLPYDHNIIGSLDGTGYINASILELGKSTYIAAQEPLEKTISDFFHLIIQKNVRTIVCLVNSINESKNEKIDKGMKYWDAFLYPMKLDGGYEIALLDPQKDLEIVERTFILSRNGEEIRRISQFHYRSWPDGGIPDQDAFQFFLKLILAKHSKAPLLCHCSAGIGRTGTFIAVHSLCREIQEKIEGGVALPEIRLNFVEWILRMRTYRKNLVTTFGQYQFIKEMVALWFTPPPDIKLE